MLDDLTKSKLLRLARATLEEHFVRGALPDFQTDAPELLERKGAFVTLHRGRDLRGCIGQLDPDLELFKVVRHCALSAAFEDPRFPPLRQKELEGLNIEISVLSPFRRVENIEEITVGRHGLYIVQGHFRGLLLPQVAEEYGWDRQTFLEQACCKAGLHESAWKDPRTIIYIFEAEVFAEPEDAE
jgi:AmmeMemoRadiSam system protein A